MSDKDKDKTVIGGALGSSPNPLPGATPPRHPPTPGQQPGPGQPTVIGGGGGWGNEVDRGASDAWGVPGDGGPAPGGAFAPAPQNPAAPPPVSGAFAPSESFFPDATPAPAQQPGAGAPVQKIDLQAALQATGLGKGGPTNPMLAAAANLLILFGRLRTQMVDMHAVPLMEHVTHEIERFEENILAAGIDQHEAQVAKYLLCGTADDIVQNIPGTDRHVWVQYSMVARFFNRRTSGVGFFQEVEKALSAPAQRFYLLELGLVCLSLGFEGQYRTAPDGAMQLQRIRGMIYDSLRRVEPRPDEDISPRWQPVLLGGRRRFGGTPLWVVGSVLGVILLGAYLALSMLISGEGNTVAARLLQLHPTETVALRRATVFKAFVPPPPPETSQLERLREKMAPDIDAGALEIDQRGDFIFVRINNNTLFASGKSDVKPEFGELATRISATLEDEVGPVKVVGFTDNIPLSGRGRFKTNFDLSVARAESVRDALAAGLSDPARLIVEGRGEADPVADNGTAEGRALNRRVEILVSREETLDGTAAVPGTTDQ